MQYVVFLSIQLFLYRINFKRLKIRLFFPPCCPKKWSGKENPNANANGVCSRSDARDRDWIDFQNGYWLNCNLLLCWRLPDFFCVAENILVCWRMPRVVVSFVLCSNGRFKFDPIERQIALVVETLLPESFSPTTDRREADRRRRPARSRSYGRVWSGFHAVDWLGFRLLELIVPPLSLHV